MPRRKVSLGLIPNRRLRASTFAKRKEGLRKKASELSTLCGVRVALVCADGDGAGAAADVWESEAGVLDAYRRQVPPEERAAHTHRAYAELELRKSETKLLKVRQEGPAALPPWDKAAYPATLDEAERLLAVVDEALRAANERRAALGLLPIMVDHDGVDGDNCWFPAAPGASDDALVPLSLGAGPSAFVGSNSANIDDGYQLLLRAQGNANEQQQVTMWDGDFDRYCSPRAMNWQQPGYAFQQSAGRYADDGMDVHTLQMAAADMYGNNNSSSIGRRLPWDAFHPPTTTDAVAMMHPSYGFECTNGSTGGNSYVGMPTYLTPQQLVPSNGIIVPLGYPSSLEMGINYVDTQAAQQQGIGGGGSLATSSNFNAGTAGDNFVNPLQAQPLAMSYYTGDLVNAGNDDYASTQWPAGRQQPALHQQQAGVGWEPRSAITNSSEMIESQQLDRCGYTQQFC